MRAAGPSRWGSEPARYGRLPPAGRIWAALAQSTKRDRYRAIDFVMILAGNGNASGEALSLSAQFSADKTGGGGVPPTQNWSKGDQVTAHRRGDPREPRRHGKRLIRWSRPAASG